jgi:hypothetical protein
MRRRGENPADTSFQIRDKSEDLFVHLTDMLSVEADFTIECNTYYWPDIIL